MARPTKLDNHRLYRFTCPRCGRAWERACTPTPRRWQRCPHCNDYELHARRRLGDPAPRPGPAHEEKARAKEAPTRGRA